MKVLLTGASGFLGKKLAARLISAGHELVCASKERAEMAGACESLVVDLVSPEGAAELARALDPELVIHLAGLANVGASWRDPGTYFQVNVLATENLLRCFPDARFLFASSGEVYGNVAEAEQPLREDRMPAPSNPYAVTKAAAERLVLASGGTAIRLFSIVGPGQSRKFALPSFAEQLAELRLAGGGRVRVGDLSARRDFTHVDDAIEAIALLATSENEHQVLNLGSGEVASIQQVLNRLVALAGVDVRIEVDPDRLRPIDIPLLFSDSGRLRALGWSPRRTLDEALSELWEERLASVSRSL